MEAIARYRARADLFGGNWCPFASTWGLAKFKCPGSYEFVDDLGRNAIGKINKSELRRRYWTEEQRVG
jgi:non-ribosomal peptide synthetase component E (peptide arylation enzyme)